MSQNVAVLIDYENTGLEQADWVLKQASKTGRVIIKRAYADWSSQGAKKDLMSKLGIEPVHHFRQTRARKNASDISMAVDAVDILHTAPVDTFVLVSSDSDFVPLVSKLKYAGKKVIGMGRKAVVSEALVSSCDEYLYLDELESKRDGTGHVSLSKSKIPDNWDQQVHQLWTDRKKSRIPGPQAAADAATVLGVSKLSDSKFSTLQKLLDASKFLSDKWSREQNVIVRKNR